MASTATAPTAACTDTKASESAVEAERATTESATASSTPHAADQQYKESDEVTPTATRSSKEDQLDGAGASTDSLRDMLDGDDRRRHVLETRLRTVRDVLKHQSMMLEQLVAYTAESHRWMVQADNVMRMHSMETAPPPQLPPAFRAAAPRQAAASTVSSSATTETPPQQQQQPLSAKNQKRPTATQKANAAVRPTDDPGVVSVYPYQPSHPHHYHPSQGGRQHPPPPGHHQGGPPPPNQAFAPNIAFQQMARNANTSSGQYTVDHRGAMSIYDMYGFGAQRGARVQMRGRGRRAGAGNFGGQQQNQQKRTEA